MIATGRTPSVGQFADLLARQSGGRRRQSKANKTGAAPDPMSVLEDLHGEIPLIGLGHSPDHPTAGSIHARGIHTNDITLFWRHRPDSIPPWPVPPAV